MRAFPYGPFYPGFFKKEKQPDLKESAECLNNEGRIPQSLRKQKIPGFFYKRCSSGSQIFPEKGHSKTRQHGTAALFFKSYTQSFEGKLVFRRFRHPRRREFLSFLLS